MVSGKIAILYANDKEGNVILKTFENAIKIKNGIYSKGKFLIYKTGVGKKNAEKAVKKLFMLYPVRAVFALGTAGALCKDLKTGDVLASERILNVTQEGEVIEEFQYYSWGFDNVKYRIKEKGLNIKSGVLISVDNALLKSWDQKYNGEKYHAQGCDMESALIGEYAGKNAVPFYCFRVISDTYKQNLPPLEMFLKKKKKSIKEKLKLVLYFTNPLLLTRYSLFKFRLKKSLKKLKILTNFIQSISH